MCFLVLYNSVYTVVLQIISMLLIRQTNKSTMVRKKKLENFADYLQMR